MPRSRFTVISHNLLLDFDNAIQRFQSIINEFFAAFPVTGLPVFPRWLGEHPFSDYLRVHGRYRTQGRSHRRKGPLQDGPKRNVQDRSQGRQNPLEAYQTVLIYRRPQASASVS
jgi:hypothetical protein